MAGRNRKIGGGGFHHVAMRVKDFDATIGFYVKGLGFTEYISWGEGDSRAAMVDTGESNYLEIFAGGSSEVKPEGVLLHMAFKTDDCDNAIEQARTAGAKVTMEPQDIEIKCVPPKHIRIAFCKGPDGEVIEFFQEK